MLCAHQIHKIPYTTRILLLIFSFANTWMFFLVLNKQIHGLVRYKHNMSSQEYLLVVVNCVLLLLFKPNLAICSTTGPLIWNTAIAPKFSVTQSSCSCSSWMTRVTWKKLHIEGLHLLTFVICIWVHHLEAVDCNTGRMWGLGQIPGL